MPATDTTLWDYAVSYGGPSLFMTAVFLTVMPLVWFKFARPRLRRWPSRLAVMLSVWMIAWFIAYGDVLLIAREAKRLCEAEAGLRVYKQATVAGFAGVFNIVPWAKRGFEFTEYKRADNRVVRQEMAGDTVVRKVVDSTRSRYEYVRTTESLSRWLEKDIQVVREISSEEVLGRFVEIRIYPGWVDRVFVGLFGGRISPTYCRNRANEVGDGSDTRLIDATLQAARSGK